MKLAFGARGGGQPYFVNDHKLYIPCCHALMQLHRLPVDLERFCLLEDSLDTQPFRSADTAGAMGPIHARQVLSRGSGIVPLLPE